MDSGLVFQLVGPERLPTPHPEALPAPIWSEGLGEAGAGPRLCATAVRDAQRKRRWVGWSCSRQALVCSQGRAWAEA